MENKIGLRIVQNGDIVLRKVFVPDEDRIAGVNSFQDTNKVWLYLVFCCLSFKFQQKMTALSRWLLIDEAVEHIWTLFLWPFRGSCCTFLGFCNFLIVYEHDHYLSSSTAKNFLVPYSLYFSNPPSNSCFNLKPKELCAWYDFWVVL